MAWHGRRPMNMGWKRGVRAETMLTSTQTACAEQCGCAGQRTHLGSRPKKGQAVLGGAPESLLAILLHHAQGAGVDRRDTLKKRGWARAGATPIFQGFCFEVWNSAKVYLGFFSSCLGKKSKLVAVVNCNNIIIASRSRITAHWDLPTVWLKP